MAELEMREENRTVSVKYKHRESLRSSIDNSRKALNKFVY